MVDRAARVRYRDVESEGAPEWGEGGDISAGGLRLTAARPLAVGSHVAIELHLEGTAAPVLALACVVSAHPLGVAWVHQLQYLWRGRTDVRPA